MPWNFTLSDAETHPCRPDEAGEIWRYVICTNNTAAGKASAVSDGVCESAKCTIVGLDFYDLYSLIGVVPTEIVHLTSLRSLVLDKQHFADEYGGMPSILGTLTTCP